jgi:flagella basal body P-ring formation protein FlgA
MLWQSLLTILLLAPAPLFSAEDPGHAEIAEAAMDLLAERFPDAAHRLEVRVIRTGGDIRPDNSLRVVWPADAGLPQAHTQVKIEQSEPTSGDRWSETGWALLYVAHFDSVALTNRSLKRDEPVTEPDIQFAWLETTRFNGAPLTPRRYAELARQGEVFAHLHLNANRALRSDDLRTAYAVETGGSVTMSYRRASIELELICKARLPGYTGDIVKLFSSASNKTYRARITGPGTAEWLETLD